MIHAKGEFFKIQNFNFQIRKSILNHLWVDWIPRSTYPHLGWIPRILRFYTQMNSTSWISFENDSEWYFEFLRGWEVPVIFESILNILSCEFWTFWYLSYGCCSLQNKVITKKVQKWDIKLFDPFHGNSNPKFLFNFCNCVGGTDMRGCVILQITQCVYLITLPFFVC